MVSTVPLTSISSPAFKLKKREGFASPSFRSRSFQFPNDNSRAANSQITSFFPASRSRPRSLPRGDPVIDSRRFTRYVMGKTGGDGIHYNRESGEAWAKPVNATIDQILAADIAVRRKLASNR